MTPEPTYLTAYLHHAFDGRPDRERFVCREEDGTEVGTFTMPTETWEYMGKPDRLSFAAVPAPVGEDGGDLPLRPVAVE